MSSSGGGARRGVLLIDGDCTFCRFAAERLRSLGAQCAIEPQTPELLQCFGVDADRARREVSFVDADGRVWWGHEAIAHACATGGTPARAAARVLAFGPLSPVLTRAYRAVADHRPTLMRLVGPFWREHQGESPGGRSCRVRCPG